MVVGSSFAYASEDKDGFDEAPSGAESLRAKPGGNHLQRIHDKRHFQGFLPREAWEQNPAESETPVSIFMPGDAQRGTAA